MLAPRMSPLEEFICQWESFSGFFSEEQNKNRQLCQCRIETTNLSSKLSEMLNILIEEQAAFTSAKKDATEICPTLEFVLQNKILDTLASIAQADSPLGISPRLLLFFTKLITDSKTTGLIPLISQPLNKLIYICGKTYAGPYESNEMTFLDSLTDKIYRNPDCLNFFLHDSFPLINALLALLLSPDSEIGRKAGEAIIKLISLNNVIADKVICEQTAFCGKIIEQIISSYNVIPRSLNPKEVEAAIYTFRSDSVSHSTFTSSMRKFLCFLKWFTIFDMLIYHSGNTTLVKTMLSQFRLEFLESCILPDLTGDGFTDETDAIDNVFLTTVLLSNCLRNTESYVLFNLISEFLTISDKVDVNIPSRLKNYTLLPMLLKRCNLSAQNLCDDEQERSKSIKLAGVTLQLFEDILLRPSRNVMNFLVIDHLRKKDYLDLTRSDENEDSFEPFLDKFVVPDVLDHLNSVANETSKHINVLAAPTVVLAKQNAMIYYFSSLIPTELKFNRENESSDYVAYLKEAIKGVNIFLISCYAHWSTDQNEEDSSVQPSNNLLDEAAPSCSEGPFLRMIFDNLSSMLSLPYEINIQIFSLIAKLSLIPDEHVNEYLLDPTTPLNSSSRSLFSVLCKLVEELQIAVQGITNLGKRFVATKKSLLGESLTEEERLLCEEHDAQKIGVILQSLIVVDEFCKEVICIIFAKNKVLQLCKGHVQSL